MLVSDLTTACKPRAGTPRPCTTETQGAPCNCRGPRYLLSTHLQADAKLLSTPGGVSCTHSAHPLAQNLLRMLVAMYGMQTLAWLQSQRGGCLRMIVAQPESYFLACCHGAPAPASMPAKSANLTLEPHSRLHDPASNIQAACCPPLHELCIRASKVQACWTALKHNV